MQPRSRPEDVPWGIGLFRTIWRLYAKMSACDGIDGSQYQRAYADWTQAGRPYPRHWLHEWLLRDDQRGAGA